MPKDKNKNDLTLKEDRFVIEYMKTDGNGTEAAMRAFRCKNRNTASVIASEYLEKPRIANRLRILREQIANRNGVTFGRLIKKAAQHLEAQKVISAMVIVKPNKDGSPNPTVRQIKGDSKSVDFIEVPDAPTQLKAVDTLAKLVGYYDNEENSNLHIGDNIIQIYLPDKRPHREVIDAKMVTNAKAGVGAGVPS